MKSDLPSEGWRKLGLSELGRSFPRAIPLAEAGGLPPEVILPSPLSICFGLNGTGKTRLLRRLEAVDDRWRIVNVSELVNYLLRSFGQRDDIDELMEETSPLDVDPQVLTNVMDLVRRNYEEILWFAVSIADSPFQGIVGDDVVPVFYAKYGGTTYDFRTMGLGELSSHLLLWLVWYTRGNSDQILLFDEPEAFMPPPSRAGLLKHLLEASLTQQRAMIVASHSLELVEPALTAGAAILLSEQSNRVSAIGPSPAQASRAAGLFGTRSEVEWILLCEDEAGCLLAQQLLMTAAPHTFVTSRFLWCGGYSDLEQMWKHLRRPVSLPSGIVRFAFVADGDKVEAVRSEVTAATTGERWPFFTLPGDPDTLFKERSPDSVDALSDHVQIDRDRLLGILERNTAVDPHEWVNQLLKESTVDRRTVLRSLASIVSESEAIVEAFRTSAQDAGFLPRQ